MNAKLNEKKRANLKSVKQQSESLQHELITQIMTQLIRKEAWLLEK